VNPPRPLNVDDVGHGQGLLLDHGRQVEAERAVVPVNRDGTGQVRDADGSLAHAPWAGNSQVVLGLDLQGCH